MAILENAFEVLLCAFVLRIVEYFFSGTRFNHFAQIHVNDIVRETFGLAQRVGYDHGGVLMFQIQ